MAVLSDQARREVWQRFMESQTGKGFFGNVTKHDILAAVASLDAALDVDPSQSLEALRAACPEPAKTELTDDQLRRLGAMLDFRRNPPPVEKPPDPRLAGLASVATKHLGLKPNAAATFAADFLAALDEGGN